MQIVGGVAEALAFLSFVLLAIAVPVTIIRALMKKPSKNWHYAALGSFVIFGVGLIVFNSLEPTEGKKPRVVGSLEIGSPAPTARPVPTEQPFPAYLGLRGGQRPLLDSNNEGDGSMGTLFDDLAAVRKWAAGQASGPADVRHHDLPIGTRIVVRSWTHVRAVSGDDYTMIDVMTVTNPRREGYVRDIYLLPMIPSGARLIVHNAVRGYRAGTMELKRTQHPPTLTIAEGTPVSSLAVSPRGDTLSHYRAEVLSGPHRGARGWFSDFSLGALSPPVSGGEYDKTCHCVSLYLREVDQRGTQSSPTDAPMPSAEPAFLESPETTRDYMNEACILMHDGAHYAFDNGNGGVEDANIRIVACKLPGGDLIYFRREHLAETKSQYQNDKSPSRTPGGYPVPGLSASDATPFPKR